LVCNNRRIYEYARASCIKRTKVIGPDDIFLGAGAGAGDAFIDIYFVKPDFRD
jgi:hypothetical protein